MSLYTSWLSVPWPTFEIQLLLLLVHIFLLKIYIYLRILTAFRRTVETCVDFFSHTKPYNHANIIICKSLILCYNTKVNIWTPVRLGLPVWDLKRSQSEIFWGLIIYRLITGNVINQKLRFEMKKKCRLFYLRIWVKKEFVCIRIVDHSGAWRPKENDMEPYRTLTFSFWSPELFSPEPWSPGALEP